MIPDFTWRQGDREPVFAQILQDSQGNPVNLHGATLGLILRSTADSAPETLSAPVVSRTPAGYSIPCQIQWTPDAQDNATIDPGIYLGNWTVVFDDGTPMSFPTSGHLWILVEESLATTGGLAVGMRPSVREVAGRLRARTKITGGRELGTFTSDTRPTDTDVSGLIDDALDEVLGKVQPIDPTAVPGSAYNAPGSNYEKRIRSAASLYAAILVELSFFPEQVKNDQSPVAVLQTLYESRIKALIAEGETGRAEGEGAGGAGGDAPADSFWSFPDAGPNGLVGWESRW